MVLLYEAARKHSKEIKGQSAIAKALNASPQTVKNWETRGVSKAGAMVAQDVFGCDANVLLGKPSASSANSHNGLALHNVRDEALFPWRWPFKTINARQYDLLDDKQRSQIEDYVWLHIKSREPPEKQEVPAKYIGLT
jgi:hypothetical protein